MPDQILFTLPDSQITLTGASSLGNANQGDASHLLGATIRLNTTEWVPVTVTDTDANFEDNDVSQTLTNSGTYDGDLFDAGRRVEAEYTIVVRTPDGAEFTLIGFNINEPGVTSYTTIEGLAFVDPAGSIANTGGFPPSFTDLTVISVGEGPSGGTTPYASYATPACFTPGTLIETPTGLRAIETLAMGDLVQTREEGAMCIRWVGRTDVSGAALLQRAQMRPIRIRAGALGAGVPLRDLVVSPQHRILIEGWRAELFFGAGRVLVAARHLVDEVTVTIEPAAPGVTYIHLAFDRHVTVMSNGCPSESFLPGPQTLPGLPVAAQAELEALFPDLSERFAHSRHRCLTAREARLLTPA